MHLHAQYADNVRCWQISPGGFGERVSLPVREIQEALHQPLPTRLVPDNSVWPGYRAGQSAAVLQQMRHWRQQSGPDVRQAVSAVGGAVLRAPARPGQVELIIS